MMKFLLGILGVILLLPIGIVLVGLLITTLIGAYGYLIIQLAWPVVVVVAFIFLVRWIVKTFFKK